MECIYCNKPITPASKVVIAPYAGANDEIVLVHEQCAPRTWFKPCPICIETGKNLLINKRTCKLFGLVDGKWCPMAPKARHPDLVSRPDLRLK